LFTCAFEAKDLVLSVTSPSLAHIFIKSLGSDKCDHWGDQLGQFEGLVKAVAESKLRKTVQTWELMKPEAEIIDGIKSTSSVYSPSITLIIDDSSINLTSSE